MVTTQPHESAISGSWYQRDCPHEHQETWYVLCSNGVKQYREQCLDCGEVSEFLKKTDSRVMLAADIQPVDEALRTQERREAFQRYQQEQDARHQVYQDDWWQCYNAYLATSAW